MFKGCVGRPKISCLIVMFESDLLVVSKDKYKQTEFAFQICKSVHDLDLGESSLGPGVPYPSQIIMLNMDHVNLSLLINSLFINMSYLLS